MKQLNFARVGSKIKRKGAYIDKELAPHRNYLSLKILSSISFFLQFCMLFPIHRIREEGFQFSVVAQDNPQQPTTCLAICINSHLSWHSFVSRPIKPGSNHSEPRNFPDLINSIDFHIYHSSVGPSGSLKKASRYGPLDKMTIRNPAYTTI